MELIRISHSNFLKKNSSCLFIVANRYPFEINKSHLASVGAPHSWPSYLAVLIWMMELIMVSLVF